MVWVEDGFNPLEPKTWKAAMPSPSLTAEEKQNICDTFFRSSEARMIAFYLRFGYCWDRKFEQRISKDNDLSSLIQWLMASESRTERAIDALTTYADTVMCPHCWKPYSKGEELSASAYPFDWEAFAASEEHI